MMVLALQLAWLPLAIRPFNKTNLNKASKNSCAKRVRAQNKTIVRIMCKMCQRRPIKLLRQVNRRYSARGRRDHQNRILTIKRKQQRQAQICLQFPRLKNLPEPEQSAMRNKRRAVIQIATEQVHAPAVLKPKSEDAKEKSGTFMFKKPRPKLTNSRLN